MNTMVHMAKKYENRCFCFGNNMGCPSQGTYVEQFETVGGRIKVQRDWDVSYTINHKLTWLSIELLQRTYFIPAQNYSKLVLYLTLELVH